MVDIIKKDYWSKADAFLFPLTGLRKDPNAKAYMFWDDVSIEDYKLIIKYPYEDQDEFIDYARNEIFPVLDKNGYLLESYDFEGFTIFILDISEWAFDIKLILQGRYSKLSKDAKRAVEIYSFIGNTSHIHPHIFYSLYPKKVDRNLDNMTAIEYVAKHYGIDYDDLAAIGEVCSIYDKNLETLNVTMAETP